MKANTFCGPYAYGKITGLTSNEAADVLRTWDWRYRAADRDVARGSRSRSRPVRTVLGMAVREALAATGAVIGELRNPGMTLAKWAAVRLKWDDANAWVVMVSGHFVVYRRGVIYDNQNPLGVHYAQHEAAKQRIKFATCVSLWNDANPLRKTEAA